MMFSMLECPHVCLDCVLDMSLLAWLQVGSKITTAVDTFSFGIMMWELYTGECHVTHLTNGQQCLNSSTARVTALPATIYSAHSMSSCWVCCMKHDMQTCLFQVCVAVNPVYFSRACSIGFVHFQADSDVWLYPPGQRAYSGLGRDAIIDRVYKKQARPAYPAGVPGLYANLSRSCWENDPHMRPNFHVIIAKLQVRF